MWLLCCGVVCCHTLSQYSPDRPGVTVSRAASQPARLLASDTQGSLHFVAVFNKVEFSLLCFCRPFLSVWHVCCWHVCCLQPFPFRGVAPTPNERLWTSLPFTCGIVRCSCCLLRTQPVTTLPASKVTLEATGAALSEEGLSVAVQRASGSFSDRAFAITVSGITGAGTVACSLAANVVQDLAGNGACLCWLLALLLCSESRVFGLVRFSSIVGHLSNRLAGLQATSSALA